MGDYYRHPKQKPLLGFFQTEAFLIDYCLWQEPDMGQLLQLPQLQTMDLPLRFFLTMLIMIAVTIAISTAQMIIVQILLAIHWNIRSTPLVM